MVYFVSIIAIGAATGLLLALILLRFASGSFLAAMGDACGGIFEAGHGFLAASNWNYLLATATAAVFLSQLAFLIGGGVRLIRASNNEKIGRRHGCMTCPALPSLTGSKWASRIAVAPEMERLEAQTVGLFRPRIVLSHGLTAALDRDHLRAVIAHEDAHRAARDNLFITAAKTVILTLFYLPGPRKAFREMRLNLERAADLKASKAAGGKLMVAAALAQVAVTMKPAVREPALSSAVSGSGSDLAVRLEALIDSGKAHKGCGRRLLLFAAGTILSLTIFSSSALAVAGSDQRQAFICFTEHQQTAGPDGVCALDHPDHT
ncbi:MAG: M48 family metalloprotease [Thermoleophilia bacterium]